MVATITGAIGSLGADLLLVGAAGIGISAGVFGLRKGWGLLRSMIKG